MRPLILHGHLFKNAGSTFDWSLRRCFGDKFLDHRDDETMREGGSKFLESLIVNNPELMAISSHVMPLMSSYPDGIDIMPIYFLRHPLLRVRSVYEFELRQLPAITPGAIEAKNKTFREYVEWRLDEKIGAIIRNYHCRYLGGLRRRGPSSKDDKKDFERAMKTLAQSQVAPIVESYDVSMIILEENLKPLFHSIDLSYVAQNVHNPEAKEISLDEKLSILRDDLGELYDRLVIANQFDLSLYEAGKKLLNNQREKISKFDKKLYDFHHRCEYVKRSYSTSKWTKLIRFPKIFK